MQLPHSLRLKENPPASSICFTGAGGKTTALFQLARQSKEKLILATATTHMGKWQTALADHHIIVDQNASSIQLPEQGVVLITGEIKDNRTLPISNNTLYWLREISKKNNVRLLIEADGSRQKPIKAPAEHEPPIPDFADMVIYVAGLSGLQKPLDKDNIHRPEIFSKLTGLALNKAVSPEKLINYLVHPQGALKNIPSSAKKIALLNQADTPQLQSIGSQMAEKLMNVYDAVLVGSLQTDKLYRVEKTAGIILAAGTSKRYGETKQLLDWKGKTFIRQVAETALQAGLEPVVIVTGSHHAEVESQLRDLPVHVIYNAAYEQGQSTSIKAGLQALPRHAGGAVFLLADQPQIPVEVIRALTESHASEGQAILAPLVLEERRANPVLFDRVTFPDLMGLQGDIGGRGIFDKHRVSYLPWHDDILLFDVDKPEDYQRLKDFQ